MADRFNTWLWTKAKMVPFMAITLTGIAAVSLLLWGVVLVICAALD